MLETVNDIATHRIQIICIVASISALLYLFNLVRKKRLKEEYSIVWLLLGLLFVVLSVWRDGIGYFAELVGVVYPPAAIFILLLIAVFIILVQFSLIISRLSENNKTLVQEIGLLKEKLTKLQKKLGDK